MKICICGGGGLGHTCSGVLSNKDGISINLLTNKPERWNNKFKVNLPNGNYVIGNIDKISNEPSVVIPESDIIFLCLPSFLVEETVLKIKPFLRDNQILGTVVANSGFFLFCHQHLPSTTKLFGLQRVPFVSRVVDYGKEANLLGYRPELFVATENIEERNSFRVFLENSFGEKVTLVDSFYEVTLSNSNPILHTGRLYTMWKDWDGSPFDKCSLFYREWTDEASKLEVEMDKEFFALLKVLKVKTDNIETLLVHYESDNASAMTQKIKSIESLSTILSPMKETNNGWMPDFESRYFTEDFPFGLRFIWQLAHENNVPCPKIDMVYTWGVSHIKKNLKS